MDRGPLGTLHVLDLSTGLAGPFCAKLLADLGANVIKIEPPGGADPARDLGPFPEGCHDGDASGAYIYANTSKQSVELELGTPAGRALFARLLATHDIVIASETEPALSARGLGHADLLRTNARTILATVTGFGSTGPYAGYAANHLITCAMGGWAATCGLPDREPLQSGGNVTEFIAGAYAAVGTLAAVEARDRGGAGQHVDTSAMEAAITAALLPTMIWEYAGVPAARNSTRATGPSWIMPCADGYIGVNVLTQAQWDALCGFLGMEDLIAEPAYATGAMRLLAEPELRARIEPWFAGRRAAEVFEEAQLWRLPFALVPSPSAILDLEQHREREFFARISHPCDAGRTIPIAGIPFRMPASPATQAPAPRLGQHTDAVLRDLLGLAPSEIADLRAAGVC